MKNKITVIVRNYNDYCFHVKQFETFEEAKNYLIDNCGNGIIIIGTEYHIIN
ncbi:MAG TPA: hypothetical protein VI911_08690 [Patescibacteria group bacterium]|nr:MAG: hypothetical protein UR43_C0005G0094 [candidate division TM6 bacterium GW2011_GWF2_33_332]HLD91073.1 hypothetical protein [Patescibacteria group bacterium]